MKRLSPRELRRLQSRMIGNLGLDMEEMGVADLVTIKLGEREIVLKGPTVISLKLEKERIFQIVGGEIAETVTHPTPSTYEPSEEDIMLVSSQAGVESSEARKALIETGGDLARAILLLKMKR
ncbi:MAG: nascent polypeptide-associated complex protein [Nitrososphaerota archaeon]